MAFTVNISTYMSNALIVFILYSTFSYVPLLTRITDLLLIYSNI
jgi:hypothetical protein